MGAGWGGALPSVQSPLHKFWQNGKKLHKNRYHSLFFSCLILLDLFNFCWILCPVLSEKNLRKIFMQELSFMCPWWNVYSVLIPRNLHCPEKFLVVPVLNYENVEKKNISLFILIGSCSVFPTAVNFSNTICLCKELLWVAAN